MKDEFTLSVVKTLQKCLPTKRPISLHEPLFMDNEWKYVKDCLDSGWVSYAGKFVEKFEQKIADFTGIKYAVATNSGTAALHISLILAGVKANDEVLAPAMTFVATINAISYCRAIPHFVDVEEKTLGVAPKKLEIYLESITIDRRGVCYNKITKRPIKALIAMHTFGHPVDIDSILKICKKYKITLIEDAAEAVGSLYKGKHVGNWGKLAILSFNGNKIITTGGGGAILTNELSLAKLAKHLTTTAKVPHQWAFLHDRVGYNYRLPNINAALGCAQLEQLPRFLKKKRALALKYEKAFRDFKGLRFFTEPEFALSNYWLNVLLLDQEQAFQRENILRETSAQGIMTRPVWTSMAKLPMFKDCPRMNLAAAQDLERRIINIPSSANLMGKIKNV